MLNLLARAKQPGQPKLRAFKLAKAKVTKNTGLLNKQLWETKHKIVKTKKLRETITSLLWYLLYRR